MKLKINEQLLCIPPFISTSWDQVSSMQTESDPSSTEKLILIIHLSDSKVIKIPDLDSSLLEIIFAAHLKHLEKSSGQKEELSKSPAAFIQNLTGLSPDQIASFPIKLGMPDGMEGVENVLQHNSSQGDAPDLPAELIQKIAGIAQIMTGGDLKNFPKAEPHCNCMHCQVARAIHNGEEKVEGDEEIVSDEDLKFRTWDIAQSGENLYTVTNPLDAQEHYNVFLGSPVGCTCGESHCEHIRAVLSS
ncbi:MAG: hypothetical protein KR126chlam2_00471 [Chlamydiae bacterium]|nr:hypothetical protein [Chlamydiota bacterium]